MHVCMCVQMKGNKRKVRNLKVRFPAATPWLVLQWPCLPACVRVGGRSLAFTFSGVQQVQRAVWC